MDAGLSFTFYDLFPLISNILSFALLSSSLPFFWGTYFIDVLPYFSYFINSGFMAHKEETIWEFGIPGDSPW